MSRGNLYNHNSYILKFLQMQIAQTITTVEENKCLIIITTNRNMFTFGIGNRS